LWGARTDDRDLNDERLPVNVIERSLRKVDAFQQRHTATALIYGVIKKYGDDNASTLVANLAYTAFGSVFVLLLLLVTILGLVLSSHPALEKQVLDSTFGQFPIIGTDLQKNIKALHRNSVISLVIAIIGLIWGSLGLAQNGIFTMSQVWNLPGPDRPNYLKRLGRSLYFLLVLAIGLATSTFLAATIPAVHGGSRMLAVAGGVASAIVNFGLYLFAFDVLTPAKISLRRLVPGAALAGVGWTILQALGGFVVGHYLKNETSVYGLFAIVLGLFAWIYLITELTVYAAELNVVLARHLWPRGLVQPPLTEADQRSLAAQALQNRRRPEQQVEVSFDGQLITEGDLVGTGNGHPEPGAKPSPAGDPAAPEVLAAGDEGPRPVTAGGSGP
jgi:YihY family inner membrane protein